MWWKILLVSQDVWHSVGETHNICFLTLSQIALFPLHLSFGNNFMGFGAIIFYVNISSSGLDTVCGDGDTRHENIFIILWRKSNSVIHSNRNEYIKAL